MQAQLRNLTSTSVLCFLFFLFFPLSKWYLLAAFITVDVAIDYINQKRSLHILGVFGVILIFSSCLFYPDFAVIMCMSLCSLIFHTMKIDPGKKFIMTTLLLGIHLLKKPSFELLIVLIAVFLFHLILTIMITSRNKIQLSQRMKVIVALGIGGSMMVVLIPYVASGIRNLLSIGIDGVASLLSGGLYQVFNLVGIDPKNQDWMMPLTSTNKDEEPYPYTDDMTHPDLYWIYILILLVIFVVAIMFIVKRWKAMQVEFKDKRMMMSMKPTHLLKKDQKKERGGKPNPPSNIPIRMLVYKFEKEMKGMQRRKHGELFHDWLNRIHLNRDEINSKLNEIYEKARYGEEDIPKKDVKFFNDGLKQIKTQLK